MGNRGINCGRLGVCSASDLPAELARRAAAACQVLALQAAARVAAPQAAARVVALRRAAPRALVFLAVAGASGSQLQTGARLAR